MTIITCAWDKTIKIHLDTRDEQKRPIGDSSKSMAENKRYDKKTLKKNEESNVSKLS